MINFKLEGGRIIFTSGFLLKIIPVAQKWSAKWLHMFCEVASVPWKVKLEIFKYGSLLENTPKNESSNGASLKPTLGMVKYILNLSKGPTLLRYGCVETASDLIVTSEFLVRIT